MNKAGCTSLTCPYSEITIMGWTRGAGPGTPEGRVDNHPPLS